MDQELRAPTEAVLMLPLGCTVEAPQDQVVVYIVPGVPDGSILEQTAVCTKYVVQDLNSWPQQRMIHVHPYLVHGGWHGRKFSTVSSRPYTNDTYFKYLFVSFTMIYFYHFHKVDFMLHMKRKI